MRILELSCTDLVIHAHLITHDSKSSHASIHHEVLCWPKNGPSFGTSQKVHVCSIVMGQSKKMTPKSSNQKVSSKGQKDQVSYASKFYGESQINHQSQRKTLCYIAMPLLFSLVPKMLMLPHFTLDASFCLTWLVFML